ncbi:WD40/YVTN/BNR-like repeat-containing protein [Crocosphaera sp. XPORK-15E]|uniref:WD40/YVTN/BNR-like repeat-containing protein n=1 Tax=Crocosphaera sp. XPORK-15E TaxID=3110247 RepID=UPI002B20E29F|nr:YCF48-related protein [Crocosphaera sp. XPORK-15E]MEA5534297.1 YCF48-related protein [Crocosphaera sp. XPORK-15E]
MTGSVEPDILFLSSYGDGMYKSQDGGTSWEKVNQGLETLKIESVAISPNDPDLVLAEGTEGGLYKTDDGGKSWTSVIDSKTQITAMAFLPNNDSQIILGDSKGNLHLSSDKGKNWQLMGKIQDNSPINAVAISPNFSTDKMILIGTDKGIFKSVDLGKSSVNISQENLDKNIRDIVIKSGENNNPKIFVSTKDTGVFQSEDEGKTWTKISQGLTKDHQADDFKVPHFYKLGISPFFSQDGVMFVGGFNGLFKSQNRGENWQKLETLSAGTVVSLGISPNYKNDGTLGVVTYVGNAYLSEDGGKTWKTINKGLEPPRFTGKFDFQGQDPRRFFDMAFSPNYESDGNIFATVLWDNFLRSTNRGDNWQIVGLPGAKGQALRGFTIVPSPNFAKDSTVYVATMYGLIMRSTDGGQNFSIMSAIESRKINESLAIVISPNFAADQTLYASGTKGIYKTTDGGKTWQTTTENTPLEDRPYVKLAISPNYQNDRTVIAGTGQGVYITKDAGKTWVKLTKTDYGDDGYVEGLAISPNYQNDQTFILSIRGKGLFKTVDGGQTFGKIGDNMITLARMNDVPAAGKAIQFSPSYAEDNTLFGFGGTRTGVYKSTDGGNTWETIAIPINTNDNYDLITWGSLIFEVYRGRILRIAAAVVVALLSYVALGYLGLEKKLPLSKLQIKSIGTFVTFIVALLILLKL